jgi:hypothetical protein
MIGTNDFIEYWTAFRLFIANRDLYDPALMATLQHSQGFSAEPPLMMWLPPWALLVLAHYLFLILRKGALLWLVASVAFALSWGADMY